jgi:hypothetical protein
MSDLREVGPLLPDDMLAELARVLQDRGLCPACR